jgi:hypothetical protein
MVATDGVAEVQDPPAIVDDKLAEPFSQIAWVPERTPAVGTGVTVTSAVADTFAQPPRPVIK